MLAFFFLVKINYFDEGVFFFSSNGEFNCSLVPRLRPAFHHLQYGKCKQWKAGRGLGTRLDNNKIYVNFFGESYGESLGTRLVYCVWERKG